MAFMNPDNLLELRCPVFGGPLGGFDPGDSCTGVRCLNSNCGGGLMMKNLIAQWRGDIVGDWRTELTGTDLLCLGPVEERFRLEVTLRADGTAFWRYPQDSSSDASGRAAPPFPQTWELDEDRVLTILIPIPPMPEYELPDWSQDAVRYDVLAVTDISLGLSDRRFDGEKVIVLRRVNAEEYERRKVQRYREAMSGLREIIERSGIDA
jgi:hypothetical protein